MRSIGRHRKARRRAAPRIEISQAEITADLHYPAGRRRGGARLGDGIRDRQR